MMRKVKQRPIYRIGSPIVAGRVSFSAAIALMLFWMPASVFGQEFSGFLEDYSEMEKQTERSFVYQSPKGFDVLAPYDSIMIDQPEIIIAADSKYKSMKPDDMKLIADALRAVLVMEFERSNYRLVTTPGPNTLYLNTAITNLNLKKKRKRLVQFTPIGIAATIATMPFRDVMDKINLQQVTFEAELLDSQTAERIGAFVESEGSATEKKQASSWGEFLEGLEVTAGRLGCRLENGKVAVDMRKNCIEEYPL
jgi:hypothetical protein